MTERFSNGKDAKADCKFFENKIYEKLAEYEDAEEKGLLLRLPCKVGDTVYLFFNYDNNRIVKAEVKRIELLQSVHGDMRYIIEPVASRGSLYRHYDSDFGKTVFLTEKEAIAALESEGD